MKQVLGFVVLAGLFGVGCGGGLKPTPRCVLNSDCGASTNLICALGFCVSPCASSRDCPNGERCIVDEAVGAADPAMSAARPLSCQPYDKAACHLTSECMQPLVCAIDLQCRNQCAKDIDCTPGQHCTSVSHVCADPLRDLNYDPVTNEFVTKGSGAGGSGGQSDGGRSDGGGTAGGSAGGSGTGGTGGSHDGGGSDAPVEAGAVCPREQTQFETFAKGDQNPSFTSGVGVRSGNQAYIFSGFAGPPPGDAATDADGGSLGNAIYVQSFDATTGTSNGPAAKLMAVDDGANFGVIDVAVAPTGEIALLYGYGAVDDPRGYGLVAVFLTPATGDAGAASLRVQRTVPLESVIAGSAKVMWAADSQVFVASWKFQTNGWFSRVRKFAPDGRGASGGTSAVPTPSGITSSATTVDESRVGASGKLFAVAHVVYTPPYNMDAYPYLTILDADGVQTGDFVALGSVSAYRSRWIVVGGTRTGFMSLFLGGDNATIHGVFVPTSGTASIFADGGADADAADAGGPRVLDSFTLPSAATTAQMISDDPAGAGGAAVVLLDSDGASFLYVTADGSKRFALGTVIASSHGAEIAISNYHGSFGVSLYDGTKHATQLAISGCGF